MTATMQWKTVGSINGATAVLLYFAAAFLPLPEALGYLTAFGFGPLLAVGFLGMGHHFRAGSAARLAEIAALFGQAGGFIVLIMLTVQQALFASMASARTVPNPDTVALVNTVQLGIDVAWDMAVGVAVVLFGLVWLSACRGLWRLLGLAGVVLGGLLIGFNLWFFPSPPVESGSVDWGPFVAIWLLLAFVGLSWQPTSVEQP